MMSLRVLTSQTFVFLFGARIRLDDLDEQARRRIRAAQIDAVVQLVPLTMSINILNAAIVVYIFWGKGPAVFLMVWGTLIALLAAAGLLSWGRTFRNRPTGASLRATRRFVIHAALLSLTWGAAPLVLFPDADLMRQLMLACLIAGMISGGAFCLSMMPTAGLTYTWTIVLASITALILAGQQSFVYVALLLLLYGVFISRNLVAHGTLFLNHIRDKLKLEEQGEVIGLLLKDFEEHSSDWLWQTDPSGALIHVSDRFADAAKKERTALQGAMFADVIGSFAEQRPPEFAEIHDCMARRTAFRDVVVPVQVGTSRRFWLLSAKPMFDNGGRFIGYRGVGADVTEKQLAEDRITYLARYDTLTGLPNRISFREEANRALATVREQGLMAALLCIDLDQFKSINDTLGHHIGDSLLKRVGARIRACARSRDIVTRLSGDEFAVLQLCPDHPTGTIALAQQLIDAFKSPFKLEHSDIVIGASIGLAVAPRDSWETDALLKCADMALYCAKAEGPGTYRFFEPEMEVLTRRRRAVEVGLRLALESGGLDVVFQPLLDLRSGTVAGCEALARWNSPELGTVSPLEFIPVAESTGLIVQIGEWVLREAVKEACRWPNGTTVAVNLSPVQFKNQKLLATVVGALAESGLPPQRLELEVTESIFLSGNDQTLEMLNNLRALGVRIALDDFGTGYSSLSYLRRFPFDKIKIDKTFINDVATRADSMAIIRAIITLADVLGISTVAEGVESVVQIDKLRELGCTQIQGFVFSPPRPAADIVALLGHRLERRKHSGSIKKIENAVAQTG